MRAEDIMNAALHYCNIYEDTKVEPLDFAEGAMWADAHPAWISVEDEMPKNRELVFITDCESADMGFYDYTDDAWQPFEKWLGNITHWMPLPAPPEHLADVSKKTSSSSEIPTNLKGGEQ